MRRETKETIRECAMGFGLGAAFMASMIWIGLGCHLPARAERAQAAPARIYEELTTMDRAERMELIGREDIEVVILEDPAEPAAPAYGYSESDLDLLAAIVYAEAGDQDFTGQRLVADVVLNRVRSAAWPNTISGVVYQPGQFSPVTDGGLDRAWGNVTESCYEAARLALAGDHVNTDVIYFSMYGCANGVFAFQHGCHYFGY